MFIAALFTIAKTWKQLKCPSTDEEIEIHIYTMEYYSAIKKNKIMPFAATWMKLEILILSEISPRKTNSIWYHLYVESKTGTDKPIYGTETDSQTWIADLWLPRGRGEEVGWVASSGLTDGNYRLWNGLAMRSCCIALGTMSDHL